MIFTDEVLFLHVPKTGGTSVSYYLLNNLPGHIRSVTPRTELGPRLRANLFDDVEGRLEKLPGRNHETLDQALPLVEAAGLRLTDFALVLAVVRNPYDLEVSHFLHLQKQHVIKRRGVDDPSVKIALTGDFERFCEEAPFFGDLPSRIERYYELDGAPPPNLRIARFERLAEDVDELIAPFSLKRQALPHLNGTAACPPVELTDRARRAIEAKYAYLFEHYPRMGAASAS